MGVLYIATVLQKNGIDAMVLDADIEGLTVKEMVESILSANPDLVGFSIMTPQLMSALDTSALLKKSRPYLPIVLGGAHISSTLDDTFSFADCFDFAVYGEGEMTMVEVIKRMKQGKTHEYLNGIQGVIYRDKDGTVRTNPPRPWIADIDTLPPINYKLIDITRYRIPTMTGRYVVAMLSSRGCPFKCTFCDAPTTTGKKVRFHSIKRAVKDIKHNYDNFGVRNFTFRDSTFTVKRSWVVEFCEAVIKSGMKISWRCGTRVNLVDEELLKLMKRAGCHIINFGVESGHPQILNKMKKEVEIDQIYRAHELTRKYGIRTYATFVIGSPGETDETMRATLKVALGIRTSLAMFFIAVAYPGTDMYEKAVEEGVVEPRWWAKQTWDPKLHSAFQKRWGWTADAGAIKIPGFDAEAWQKCATRAFYMRPRFVWDTLIFTLKNPYFLKHLINLSTELLPFYKIPLLFQKTNINKEYHSHSKCPSAPTVDYYNRKDVDSKQKI
ncbi:Fe-S oxidoreductase [Candidatus Scalindua japonica]|uniref:Fe-S oxidoreductase n=2 Tax=Candidatus Scalindua japonica TaxID=1284222 RepID=A0A286TX35_9BACT|nr:Fe-S oxidoreductase [Candidatus Scalindua japonica]